MVKNDIDNNINNNIDDLFNLIIIIIIIIIIISSEIPEEFYEILDYLEFLYPQRYILTMEEADIDTDCMIIIEATNGFYDGKKILIGFYLEI